MLNMLSWFQGVGKSFVLVGRGFVDTRHVMRNIIPLLSLVTSMAAAQEWKPVPGHLMTKWAEKVNPAEPLPEYPRPQMTRREWVNLNGLWEYAITLKDQATAPTTWAGQILVPFAIESALSGVGKTVGEKNALWYRLKTGKLKSAEGKRWVLHFGGVDWEASVWVNGKVVGGHKGGYDGFSFDVTDALKDGENEVVVKVWDPTDTTWIPRGKQVKNPGGIFYTSVTGIWQTVWAEPVPVEYVEGVQLRADVDRGDVEIVVEAKTSSGTTIDVGIYDDAMGGTLCGHGQTSPGQPLRLKVENAKLWTPESPHLYGVVVAIQGENEKRVDEVHCYFGMRKVSLGKDERGHTRILLNNQPYFHYGPLDQGWWPDGLYTAPTDDALKYDVEMTKEWGMNMLRKHVKVEPARFYYWCDRLGVLVWQDMPSGDASINADQPDIQRSAESAANFEAEWTEIIGELRNYPSIIMWVPFNEGWGQYDTARIVEFTRKLDPTRLVNCASGWTDRAGVGDVHDMHNYPGPGMFPPEEKRASVLGEFGGLGLPEKGHTWVESDKNWGYRTFKDQESLTKAYEQLLLKLRPLVGQGLSAAIYTQTTDVEVEVNGLMTYDRKVNKIPTSTAALAKRLYLPPPVFKVVLPTSEERGFTWRYTTTKPADGWVAADFEDKAWSEGAAGFGTPSTPGTKVRTEWSGTDIWLRRAFELKEAPQSLSLRIYHDEDTEVFLNGEKIVNLPGHIAAYTDLPLEANAAKLAKPGRNVLAVHTKQSKGGQYIDAGLAEIIDAPLK